MREREGVQAQERTPLERGARESRSLLGRGTREVECGKLCLERFVLGTIFGVLQTDHPWRGKGVLANSGLMIGCCLAVAALMVMIWLLTAVRLGVGALIWRKRG
jgi:hypothetical protein